MSFDLWGVRVELGHERHEVTMEKTRPTRPCVHRELGESQCGLAFAIERSISKSGRARPVPARNVTEVVGPQRMDLPTFVGGLRLPFFFANFGWPGSRLIIHSDGVVLGPSYLIFVPFVPKRLFRFSDCDIQAVGTMILTQGIRFCSVSSGRWAVFWCPPKARPQILDILGRLSVNLNPVPERLNIFHPGPRRSR